MKLYNHPFSPNAKRPRVCAAECGIPLELVNLDFAKGEHKAPEYLKLNPMGKIPTLVDGDYVLWESPAMLFHLAGKAKDKGLLPSGDAELVEAVRWIAWNAAHLDNAVGRAALERLIKPAFGGSADETAYKAAETDFARYAPVLDAHLAGKTWALGERFSIVDIALAATVDIARAAGLDVNGQKNLASWLGRVTERPSWKA